MARWFGTRAPIAKGWLRSISSRWWVNSTNFHHIDVKMRAMGSQITSLTIVYSTICSGVDQRKHQSSASLAFVRRIHRWPVNSPHKGQWCGKCFHLMTSSWKLGTVYFQIAIADINILSLIINSCGIDSILVFCGISFLLHFEKL